MTGKKELQVSTTDLDLLIARAIKRINGTKENDLCRYLPSDKEGHIHHFTFKKLKYTNPSFLFGLVQEYIIAVDAPVAFPPKTRAPRGSLKMRDHINFTRGDIEHIIELARKVGDVDLVARFSPKRPLAALKRALIRSIQHDEVDTTLWKAFVETLAVFDAKDFSKNKI